MTYNEFKESFHPLAMLGFSADKLPGAMDVYFKALRDLDGTTFREACLQISETDDITISGRFPSPNRFRLVCSDVWRSRHSFSVDTRIGNRPQDIRARADFFETVRKLTAKHGNKAPEGFTTPLFSVYQNCVRELRMMDTYHELHGEKEPVKESEAA